MEALSVVVVQFQPIDCSCMDEVDKNVDKILDYMERASFGFPGYDLIIFPECCQGYSRIINETLLEPDSIQIRRIQDKCRDLKVWAIIAPYYKEVEGTHLQQRHKINDMGETVHSYVKMNTWTPGETAYPGWRYARHRWSQGDLKSPR